MADVPPDEPLPRHPHGIHKVEEALIVWMEDNLADCLQIELPPYGLFQTDGRNDDGEIVLWYGHRRFLVRLAEIDIREETK